MVAVGISPKQFAEMQGRTSSPRRSAGPVMAETPGVKKFTHKIVLGIDPSLRGTGYGVVQLGQAKPLALAHGTVHCPAGWLRSRCLVRIGETLRDVIRQYNPTVCAIEGLFYAQNLQTAILMGEARGACLLAAAEGGLEIFELAPRKVKQAVVGYGAAQKLAVAKMVQRMLQLADIPDPDAADALALALALTQEMRGYNLKGPKAI